jgi:PAS domain S-box-containing protein
MNPASPPRDPAGRLLATLLVCFGVAIVFSGVSYYEAQKQEIEQAARETLDAVADLKVAQIRQWREELLGDANWILHGSTFGTNVRQYFADPADAGNREHLTAWLDAWQQYQACSRVLLVDTTGKVQLAAPAEKNSLGPRSQQFVARTVAEKQVLVSDLHLSVAMPGAIDLDVFVPLVERTGAGSAGEIVGVLMIEIDPQAFLYPMIEAWPTPSRTAETLLVRRDGDEIVYLNELRHRKGTALKLKLPVTLRNAPAVKAVLGETGIVEGVDYRGVPVLAALRKIPDSPWFIVAKQDQVEILAPLQRQAWTTGAVVGALILSVLLGLALLWRRRERLFARQELAERAAAEAVLRESEAHYRSLFENMLNGFAYCRMLYDGERPADFTYLAVNTAFGKMTGLTNVVGRKVSEVIPGIRESDPGLFQIYGRVAQTGAPEQFEIHLAALKMWFAISVYSPRPEHFVAVFDVITERKRAEQERAALIRDLERMNAELEELIYVASHDLRAPLVNLQGFGLRLEKASAELAAALQSPEVPAAVRESTARMVGERIPGALKFIRASVEKMDALVSGLLRVSRLGHVSLNIERIDMNQLIRDVIATQTIQIQAAGAEVQAGALPACAGDANLLNQVFSNLLDNALKYRDPARPLQIRFWGRIEDERAIYSVTDTGVGIAPEHQSKIWEMFHRLHPEGAAPGEGLGLNLVRRILDRHRGRVWVESTPGQGSRFFVSLPATSA